MPYILEDLLVDRVDLVDEGANTGAFIEIFKRKEDEQSMEFSEILAKMKPEHAEVVTQHISTVTEELEKAHTDAAATLEAENATLNDTLNEVRAELEKANDALAKANEELETFKAANAYCECDGEADEAGACSSCGKPKKALGFDEAEVLKAMPENLRNTFIKMREQKEAAEELVRKAAEEKRDAEAVAKAATLKALPVEQDTLVAILKSCDSNVVDVLTTVAAAIEGTVLSEVGKAGKGDVATDAWGKIESEAEKLVARDASITKQKAIGIVIKENPELYQEYLKGGND